MINPLLLKHRSPMKQKLIILCCFFMSLSAIAYAQTDSIKSLPRNNDGKNLLKLNVPGLFVNNFTIEYERAVANKISIGAAVRYMPKSRIPFRGIIESLVDDDATWGRISDTRMSNFSISPEVKFYFGKETFRGLYLAPFVRYASYDGELPNYRFDVNVNVAGQTVTDTRYVDINGHLRTFTGGVLLGAQWKLSKLLYLDWWILGPQYGTNSGKFSGNTPLNTEEERQALRDALKDLEDLPIVKTEVTVDEKGGTLKTSGGWTGVRAGLALGVRF